MTHRLSHKIIVFFLLSFAAVHAQDEFLQFSPGARSIALGYSGVVQVYDPTALYWNPAAIAIPKTSVTTISSQDPYLLNFVGFTQFVPKIASFGIAFGRTSNTEQAVNFGTLGWGRKIFTSTYVGAAINSVDSPEQNYASASFGFLFRPQLTLWDTPPTFFYSPYVVDRLEIGITVQNLGLGIPDYTHEIRFGLSYKVGSIGPSVVYAHHFSPDDDTEHMGLLFEPIENFNVFAGFKNFEPDNMSIGLSYTLDNFMAQISFDSFRKRLMFSANIRLGSSSDKIADRYYELAKESLRSRNKRTAMQQADLALEYDNNHQNSYSLMQRLQPIIEKEDAQIDSLLQVGYEYESKSWYMGAAAQYLQVLKIDPNNSLTRDRIAMIRPRVEIQSDKWYKQGYDLYAKGDFKHAKDIFESILLVKPEHLDSNNYLKKINDMEYEEARSLFYQGLGYYGQRNLDLAENAFTKALQVVPDFTDAQDYLDRINQDRLEIKQKVGQLLQQAENYEQKYLLKSAQNTYRDVVEIDPTSEIALAKISELDVKINNYVTRYYNRGVSAINSGDYASAKLEFNRVLAMDENNAKAKAYLVQIINETADKTFVFYNSAQALINKGEWKMALAELDSALSINPDFKEATDLRQRTVQMIANEALLEQSKNHIRQGNLLDALQSLDQLVEDDPRNLEALELREYCQKELNKKVDEYFNRGIQLYIEEKYAEAIQTWNIVLRINPYHKGADEYKKRALERLKTLNRLE